MTLFSPNQLIAEVKKRPGLYQSDAPIDREEKLMLWKEIGSVIYHDWESFNKATVYDRDIIVENISGFFNQIDMTRRTNIRPKPTAGYASAYPFRETGFLQLQKKWRSLRDAFNRELRSRRSGVRVHRRVYRYFKSMSFMGGFEGSVSDKDESEENIVAFESLPNATFEDDPTMEAATMKFKPVKRRRIKRQPSEEDHEVEEVEMPVFPVELAEGEVDSDRLFMLSFLPEMRQLPVNIKMWVRSQIANTMQEAVSCHYSNTRPGTSSSDKINFVSKRRRHDSTD